MTIDVIKVLLPAIAAFTVGIALTPLLTHYLYKHKAWKKRSTSVSVDGSPAPISQKLHNDENKKTPRMGGIIIWTSTLVTTLFFWLLAYLLPGELTAKLDFLSRDQTWIPLFTLLLGAGVGLVDDLYAVTDRPGYQGGGLSLKTRLLVVSAAALFVGWWFWDKLDVTSVGVPFSAPLEIGILVIPLFILISLGLYASGVIDGIDGLSGGVFGAVFAAYALIAFFQTQLNVAALAAAISGSILAFLWFNIPPARFYMSDTGSMALTLALAAIVFMTDALGGGIGVAALPLIGFLLVATVLSNIIQVVSKKLRGGKKVFVVAPLHHHFEAIGWPSAKVTMRYWVLAIMFAIVGVAFALVG